MNDDNKYDAVHETARRLIGPRKPRLCSNDTPQYRALELLMEVENIRHAAIGMMLDDDSEIAADLLLCIANEVRRVKLLRTPLADQDMLLFHECADDVGLYRFIHD